MLKVSLRGDVQLLLPIIVIIAGYGWQLAKAISKGCGDELMRIVHVLK